MNKYTVWCCVFMIALIRKKNLKSKGVMMVSRLFSIKTVRSLPMACLGYYVSLSSLSAYLLVKAVESKPSYCNANKPESLAKYDLWFLHSMGLFDSH